MGGNIFVDTSGFYSLLVTGDDMHERAAAILRDGPRLKTRFVTSDYVLDETITLLRARGLSHLAMNLLQSIRSSRACHVEWMGPERFDQTCILFRQHPERTWSFTDCFSFCLMKEQRIRDALTKDEHFEQAGFRRLLDG
jgi:predicted nucleic acid-binding protein